MVIRYGDQISLEIHDGIWHSGEKFSLNFRYDKLVREFYELY